MDIRQLRRHKTLELIKQKGISKAEFSRQLGKSPQQMNELLRDKNPKNIGHNIARLIEKTFALKEDSLDKLSDQSQIYSDPGSIDEAFREAEKLAEEFARIRKQWLIARTDVVRKTEDEFLNRVSNKGVEIAYLRTDFDFIVGSEGQTSYVNLFIPMPGYSRWNCPQDLMPDYLAIAILGENGVDYAIIPKHDFQKIAKKSSGRILVNTISKTANEVDISPFMNGFDVF